MPYLGSFLKEETGKQENLSKIAYLSASFQLNLIPDPCKKINADPDTNIGANEITTLSEMSKMMNSTITLFFEKVWVIRII
jgi:hypothetical protein